MGQLPLAWCSQVHHYGFSSRRPGFESRREHLTSNRALRGIIIPKKGQVCRGGTKEVQPTSGFEEICPILGPAIAVQIRKGALFLFHGRLRFNEPRRERNKRSESGQEIIHILFHVMGCRIGHGFDEFQPFVDLRGKHPFVA